MTVACNAAAQALVRDNVDLVQIIAWRMKARFPQCVDVDDLVSAGNVGLVQAAIRYDASRGVKFRSYARKCIRGAILDDLRVMDWVPRLIRSDGCAETRKIMLVEDLPNAGGECGTIWNALEDTHGWWTEISAMELIDSAGFLDERERRLLVMRYECGFSYKLIGAVLGVCESRVGQMLLDILSMLRDGLAA